MASTYLHKVLEIVETTKNEKLLLDVSALLKKEHERQKEYTMCKLSYLDIRLINPSPDPSCRVVQPILRQGQLLVKVKTDKLYLLKDSITNFKDVPEGLFVQGEISAVPIEFRLFITGFSRRVYPILRPVHHVWKIHGNEIKLWKKRSYITDVTPYKE